VTLPSHIGQYRIIRKIGAGGMGLVYLGEHTLLGRRAAVKTLLPTVAANREIVERFFNEARATSAIADPGVIQVFDFGYHVDGTAYIVMELLEGEALSARLERLGKLPLGDALRFARQIAGSLAAAHAKDIVHRDLKPENIFLVRDPEAQSGERIKIIDFGICKMGAGDPMLTEVGAMIGTPVYMSPEQCRGSGEVDARSDVYAFGCLLFHLLTGRPPFIGEASGDLIVAHLQEEPPPPSRFAPELPPAVDALVLGCLAKAPDDRFASMTALQTALGALVIEAEAAAPSAAAVAPRTVPLGRGFRSVYDANFAALGRSSLFGGTPGSPIPQALRSRLQFAPPPETTPAPDDADDADDFDPPSRRAGIRAALACVLVVGVAAGLIATPLVLGNDERSATRVVRPAALPIEKPAARSAFAASPTGAGDGAVHPSPRAVAGTIAAPATPSGGSREDHEAETRDAETRDAETRETREAREAPARLASDAKPVERPRPRPEPRAAKSASSASRTSRPSRVEPAPAPSAGRSTRSSSSSGPVTTGPVTTPSAVPVPPPAAAAQPPPPAAAPPAPPPRPASPPSPSAEDLYDTR
jgi:serine/threonine protein kinase